MSNWEHRIDLVKIWKRYESEEIEVNAAGKEVAQYLRNFLVTAGMDSKNSDELKEIAFLFDNESETIEDFNHALNQLYDWGDIDLPTPKGKMQRKMAWIAVLF